MSDNTDNTETVAHLRKLCDIPTHVSDDVVKAAFRMSEPTPKPTPSKAVLPQNKLRWRHIGNKYEADEFVIEELSKLVSVLYRDGVAIDAHPNVLTAKKNAGRIRHGRKKVKGAAK